MPSLTTLRWLQQVLVPYHSSDHVYTDVNQALDTFPSLSPRTDTYTYDDGRARLLLCLHGTVPVQFRSQTYNFPIAIWIPHEYPKDPPLVYVVPTATMVVRQSHSVELSGRVTGDYVDLWSRKWEGCSLLALVQSLQTLFSREPPLYAKPKSPAQQVAASSSSSSSSSTSPGSSSTPSSSSAIPPTSKSHNASAITNGNTTNPLLPAMHRTPPPPPPPPHPPIASSSSSPSASTSNTPQHDTPPPRPPRPPGTASPPSSSHQEQEQTQTQTQAQPHPPSLDQQSLPVQPQPVPTVTDRSQIYHSQSPPQMQPQPQQQQQPPLTQIPPNYIQQQQPLSQQSSISSTSPPPPPRPPLPQQPQPQPQAQSQYQHQQLPPYSSNNPNIPPPVPHNPIAPTPAPAASTSSNVPVDISRLSISEKPPNLMDSDSLSPAQDASSSHQGQDQNVNTNTNQDQNQDQPQRPPNPELQELKARLAHKLTSSYISERDRLAAEDAQLDALAQDLQRGNAAILDEQARLNAVKEVCQQVAYRYKTVVDQTEQNIRSLIDREPVDVDELVFSTTVASNQLWDLVAEDNALEDTIWQLGRGLNGEFAQIDLDRFVKRVRALAREQFVKRLLINKIHIGMSTTTNS